MVGFLWFIVVVVQFLFLFLFFFIGSGRVFCLGGEVVCFLFVFQKASIYYFSWEANSVFKGTKNARRPSSY